MMARSTEKELVVKLKNGDSKAFEELFESYHHKVFNFSKSVLGFHAQAEEITQEVFIAVWQNRQKVDPHGSFVSYIFAIARNQINNIINKVLHQKAFVNYLINKGEKPQMFTENEVMYNELDNILNNAVEQLPLKRKEIYKASKIDGLTYRQIAEKFNISENTVDTQMRKALDTVRQKIKEEYNYKAFVN